MKKILGLDLGTTSIGWALVNEAESKEEQSSIIKLGVRVNPLTVDEQSDFEKGKSISTNADRTKRKDARRNLQRYKLRREYLIDILKSNGFISDNTILSEQGNHKTFETYRLRSKAVSEEISLSELSRVLLMINKKRGYKSSRKAKSKEEGQIIDGMSVAKQLYESNMTPGQFSLSLLQKGMKRLPDYYRSDLIDEFNKIWNFQASFYPDILTDSFREAIISKGKTETIKFFIGKYKIFATDIKGKDKRNQIFQLRTKALDKQLSLEDVALVVSEVNGNLNISSGYLGDISDRSKELYFSKMTVGQYYMSELDSNPNFSIKNQIFYRQDYLDEFETIWETQAKFHKELTSDLKNDIRDVVIFYQRPLRSQKGLVSFCEFENYQKEVVINGKKKTIKFGCRVCPKSSPLFQEFKIWQTLNDILVIEENNIKRPLEQEEKELLFSELSWNDKLSKNQILKLLYSKTRGVNLNFQEIGGNKTLSQLFNAYLNIIEENGYDRENLPLSNNVEAIKSLSEIFSSLGFDTRLLYFNSELESKEFEEQPIYRLWHLLYSSVGDDSRTGNDKLIKKLSELYGFNQASATILANITFEQGYGNLSTKAMRKILPYMKDGNSYSLACEYAGYKHSKRSLTKEELDKKIYKDHLEIIPRNSLRNPVVEKIINQMINVINEIIIIYGKPDEIRIELARDLKMNKDERKSWTDNIRKANLENESYKLELQEEFGIKNVSRNDVIRYKLYLELKSNGFKTLYSNTYIPKEKLFSKEFDIEHIIPQAMLFDDSMSNKTIESKSININKGKSTAYDYVKYKYGEQGLSDYKSRITSLLKDRSISQAKYNKLLMGEADVPTGFIDRDLRDSQYIARKAREILEDIVKFVTPTTGSITDRLREDWQLVNVMQELNWNKYDKLGLTEIYEDKDGRQIRKIKDWTKRNDHRHHAMDALTIAFTKPSIIQYLNNLNARSDKASAIYAIEKKELYRDKNEKLKFIPPMPIDEFRAEAKKQLESLLVSIKSKNKVVTRNTNKTKKLNGYNAKVQLTPRGQLHNDHIYGLINRYESHFEKVGSSFDANLIGKVSIKRYREALLQRLIQYDNDPKKAFTGKNSLKKNPVYLDDLHTCFVPEKVKITSLEVVYTLRKPVNFDLKVDKVVDSKIRSILENRLKEFNDDPKLAFSNLKENPIWLNKEKGIDIKSVTTTAISTAIPLREKRDLNGNFILDSKGNKIPSDYVSPNSNHHVAIYKDKVGSLQDVPVSFFEAVTRANLLLSVIDKDYKKDEGWQFLFTMKQNEYFVFPNKETGFDPKEIDLKDPNNYVAISPNLYRLQTMSKLIYGNRIIRDYKFRHHLETTVEDNIVLKDITYKQYKTLDFANTIVKVRVNHIGQIVSVGEY